MIRIWRITYIIVICSLILIMAIQCYLKLVPINPILNFNEVENFKWISKQVPKSIKTKFKIIIVFHPECEYCQIEAREIELNHDKFPNVEFWWISYAKKFEILDFKNRYFSPKTEGMSFGYIPIEKLTDVFGSSIIPHIYVYNEEQNLIGEFKGSINGKSLIQLLK